MRRTSVASLAVGDTSKIAGITLGMITSMPAFPLSKSKLAAFVTGTGNVSSTARMQIALVLAYRGIFIVLTSVFYEVMVRIRTRLLFHQCF
jgi:hypothetical protein